MKSKLSLQFFLHNSSFLKYHHISDLLPFQLSIFFQKEFNFNHFIFSCLKQIIHISHCGHEGKSLTLIARGVYIFLIAYVISISPSLPALPLSQCLSPETLLWGLTPDVTCCKEQFLCSGYTIAFLCCISLEVFRICSNYSQHWIRISGYRRRGDWNWLPCVWELLRCLIYS